VLKKPGGSQHRTGDDQHHEDASQREPAGATSAVAARGGREFAGGGAGRRVKGEHYQSEVVKLRPSILSSAGEQRVTSTRILLRQKRVHQRRNVLPPSS
jgi:hypothetical protein